MSSSTPIIQPPAYAAGLFWELRKGFFLPAKPDIDLSSEQFRTSLNPWIRLAALLEAAKAGDFRQCHYATDVVLGCQDPSVWHAWSMFIGHVCPIAVVKQAIEAAMGQFPDAIPDFVFDHASSAIAATQQLSLLPTVVDWYVQRRESELGELLALRLGQLLEPEWGDISGGEMPGEALLDVIQSTHQRFRGGASSERMSVRGGELFKPERTARRMLDIVRSSNGDLEEFIDDRMIFEATTGIDLGPCFKDKTVQRLTAAALMENALLDGNLQRFRAGERYFFGHVVPD